VLSGGKSGDNFKGLPIAKLILSVKDCHHPVHFCQAPFITLLIVISEELFPFIKLTFDYKTAHQYAALLLRGKKNLHVIILPCGILKFKYKTRKI
jgi:hypothetical protein